jgi:predicted nucleic acid-binding protein
MIADTTFLIDLLREQRRGQRGPAHRALTTVTDEPVRTTIISAGEILVGFPDNVSGWDWLADWEIYRLNAEVVSAAADLDRKLLRSNRRLGENDTWIAGFALCYGERLLSRDRAFDRVPGLVRVAY